MQDIAGCRLVVRDEVQQDGVLQSLQRLFPDAAMVDRRRQPSHGYRAVHLIVRQSAKRVEVQVRSFLQDKWAALAEKFSEREPAIKYGGGNEETLRGLETLSRLVANFETLDKTLRVVEKAEIRGSLAQARDTLLQQFKRLWTDQGH